MNGNVHIDPFTYNWWAYEWECYWSIYSLGFGRPTTMNRIGLLNEHWHFENIPMIWGMIIPPMWAMAAFWPWLAGQEIMAVTKQTGDSTSNLNSFPHQNGGLQLCFTAKIPGYHTNHTGRPLQKNEAATLLDSRWSKTRHLNNSEIRWSSVEQTATFHGAFRIHGDPIIQVIQVIRLSSILVVKLPSGNLT